MTPKQQISNEDSERTDFMQMRSEVRKGLLAEELSDNSIGRLADQVQLDVLRRISAN